ncbi:CIC11C00000005781 [Sungouiella intermedia]|uniref:CIC11C00000005781 n=1 Tax=Sungouiella intermedia TaxID=45354 RepID=A0A1L0C6X4_9ASCO|nr:CIC11C00000005781 [[Candida] intermedia]
MYSIVDTHVHLMADVHDYWNWNYPHPLAGNHRLDEYAAESHDLSTKSRFTVDGLIWIEADAKYEIDKGLDGVRNPIEECQFVLRYISGTRSGEGTTNAEFIKALVPWAPIPWGYKVQLYVDELKKELGQEFSHVKAFRFLVQDKPSGTIVDSEFIDGLRWMDAHNYAFDWGIDVHNGGLWQFRESLEVFNKVPHLRYIINHLTKPNLELGLDVESTEQFILWKSYMKRIFEATPNSYMKLSGGFSELQGKLTSEEIVDRVYPWFKVTFDLWGVDRTIWASNWPVCAINSGPNLVAKWFTITERIFDKVGVEEDDRQKIYNGNWLKAYR